MNFWQENRPHLIAIGVYAALPLLFALVAVSAGHEIAVMFMIGVSSLLVMACFHFVCLICLAFIYLVTGKSDAAGDYIGLALILIMAAMFSFGISFFVLGLKA